MSGVFTSSKEALIKFSGYDKKKLPLAYEQGVDKVLENGGKAEQVGQILPEPSLQTCHSITMQSAA